MKISNTPIITTHTLHKYKVHLWRRGDLWYGPSMCAKVNHRGKTILTPWSLRWLPPSASLTLTHVYMNANKACAMARNHLATHDNSVFYRVPVSTSLLFFILGWRWCSESKFSGPSSVLSRGHIQLIPVIRGFHVPVTIGPSVPGCDVGCISRIMNNSFNTVWFRHSEDVLCCWLEMPVSKVIWKVGK